ncbi:hypothetical protein [Demequina salsinemoris]|uniref:hypothetical protein n=1 Tax=Demequina salsinemoris TaxID=577470 RepID=UPI0007802F13|nr:hypothetical protein [Demequina salsinemoris]
MTTMQHPERWERQDGETPRAFGAFAHYRDAGPTRSLRSTAEAVGVSHRTVFRWSSAHEWVSRAAWWDAECDRARQRAYRAAVIDAQTERQARAEAASGIARTAREAMNLADLPPSEVRHWQALADRLTADAYGLGTSEDVPVVQMPPGPPTSAEAVARLRLAARQATEAADAAEARLGGPVAEAEGVVRRIAESDAS